jgi:transposase
MKAGPDRRYTAEFRDSAVKQVIDGGRAIADVARSLEMSGKSLANWVYRARKGQELVKRAAALPASELEAELSRLRQENAKLKLEKEILKNRLRGRPRPICIETGTAYTVRPRRRVAACFLEA